MVSVDLTETKVYGTGPNQTTVVTESKGELPRLDLSSNSLFFLFNLHQIVMLLFASIFN